MAALFDSLWSKSLFVLPALCALFLAGPAGVGDGKANAIPAPARQMPTAVTRPAPAALQARLAALVRDYGEPVGVAVGDVSERWTAGVDAEGRYPQQSVSKLWVALAVLKAVEEGRLELEREVVLTNEDRSVFSQPVCANIDGDGFQTTIASLLRRAIVESDNAANDRLLREVGGPGGVLAALQTLGVTDLQVGDYERDLQALIAGLTWRQDYGTGRNFQLARSQLTPEARRAALDAYLADPPDGAQPAAIVRTLGALQRGELLSARSTQLVLDLMTEVRTGPRRLKGGLPAGWSIAHKTGTGQDFNGASIGINDVGLLTAPDGRIYAVAVMIRRTARPVPQRLALMQAVTHAVADHWSATHSVKATMAAL